MSYVCNKCGTTFDSPFCPNCGTPAQQPVNSQPVQPIKQQPYNGAFPQNQYIPNPNFINPGKKKNHGCLFWGLIVLCIIIGLVIFSVIFASCISAFSEGFKEGYNKADSVAVLDDIDNAANESNNSILIAPTITPLPTPTINPFIKVTSTDLIAIYKDNQVKCKKLYDKQLLEVTGTVQNVGTDILDNTYVCLGSDTEMTIVGIQCYAKNKDEVDKIAELKEGDIITVRGKGDCGSLSFSLDKAEIIQ